MKRFNSKNDLPLMHTSDGIVLFHPHIPKTASERINKTLNSRWIGHGPQVDEFEARFKFDFNISGLTLAVGSGTDALHLAYLLAGIKKNDEVLTPLFTCTATNIPLLYIGAKPVFVDVNPRTLNICVDDLKRKITSKTKAIICVHYGGFVSALGGYSAKDYLSFSRLNQLYRNGWEVDSEKLNADSEIKAVVIEPEASFGVTDKLLALGWVKTSSFIHDRSKHELILLTRNIVN